MGAQRIEELFVLAAAVAFGIYLFVVETDRLPEPAKWLAERLGRYKKPVAIAFVLLAACFAVAPLLG